jgi:hypothetical protein
MTTMKRLLAAVALLALIGSAHAAEPIMPVYFAGDWCLREDSARLTDYRLPSWAKDGECSHDKILSVDAGGFGDDNIVCELTKAVRVRIYPTTRGMTQYTALIVARCNEDAANNPNAIRKLRTFEFTRYKGNLWIDQKTGGEK